MTFARLTDLTARCAGHPWAVISSIALVVVWAFAGPYFEWSEGHQLFINTVTTIITFWLVFVIQATQNRDTLALHAKIDELIRATDKARNDFIGIDRKTTQDVEELRNVVQRDGPEEPGPIVKEHW